MSKPIARTGICQGGPLNAAVHTERDKRSFSPDMTGTYYYREASGPTPGKWLWVPTKGDGKK